MKEKSSDKLVEELDEDYGKGLICQDEICKIASATLGESSPAYYTDQGMAPDHGL